jgi:hypothetical protein
MAEPTVPSSIPSQAGTPVTASGATSELITPSSDQNILQYKYNSLPHNVEIYLQNSGLINAPEAERHRINPAAIINLSITDSLNDWVVGGSLTLMFVPEGTPFKTTGGQTQNTKTKGAIETGKNISSYQFRADGYDYLRVCIKPINTSKDKKSNLGETGTKRIPELQTEDPKWFLSYLFSIINIEDITDIPELKGPMGPYMKCLRLSFHDCRYQMLRTTNLEYSTGLSPEKNEGSNLYNNGTLPTGKALLEIFNKVLTNAEIGGAPGLGITPTPEKWDNGIGEIFYTSPAQSSAEDDVEYLLANHVSSIPLGPAQESVGPPSPNQPRDICVLHTERPNSLTQLEPICLSPLTNFFKKAGKAEPGPLQYEHFFVTGDTDGSNSPTNTFKAPVATNSQGQVDITTAKYHQIISYSFVDIAPLINSDNFRTTPVHSVDLRERKFRIDFKANEIKTARKAITDAYITNNLYLEQAADTGNFLLQIHKSKEKSNIFPTFSLNADNPLLRQRNGLHKLLYTGIFQNQCICFSVLGLTLRESGVFIGIDKTVGATSNDYNNKLYGQWFVIKVDHVFEGGTYINNIYAIKMHRSKPLEVPFKEVL